MVATIQRYGWHPDHLDQRDHKLSIAKPVPLPPKADLRAGCPPVYDQGQLGSCTANAIAAAFDFERRLQKEPLLTPSRLFIYFNERSMEGTIASDAGAEIRDGIKSIASLGVCAESEWMYDPAKFAVHPASACYADALKSKAVSYSSVTQNAYYLRHCIAILGRPVVFGFSVFEAFESAQVAKTGIVPMPGPTDSPIGGHAVLAVGYDDTTQMVLVRNSWGASWGLAGYFWIPYAYIFNPNLADDFWTIMMDS